MKKKYVSLCLTVILYFSKRKGTPFVRGTKGGTGKKEEKFGLSPKRVSLSAKRNFLSQGANSLCKLNIIRFRVMESSLRDNNKCYVTLFNAYSLPYIVEKIAFSE